MTEFDVTKKAIKMLEKEYGFDIDQIKQEVKFVKLNNQEAIVDIVVYGKEKGKITKDVVLVVEVKSGPLLSPLYEHQLKITMSYTNAQYGMVFNGEEKSCLSQEIDADVKSLHKKNVSDFGEFSLIADIPTKKKIKNKPKQEANLDNFARAKIAEIRHFLDRVLETKSSHNFLIYFMIQAKIGLKLNNFGAMPSKKWEKLHALIRTFPERYEKIDRKKIENKDDLSKLSKKELVVLASELQSKATRLTKNELVERWAGIILAGEDEEKFIKNQLELIEKKDVKHLHHFIGLFEVEELELLAMEKYFRELPLPDPYERYTVIWRTLVSLLRTGNPKKDRMLIPYFEPMFEYCFDNVLDDLGLKMDVSGQRPEDAYYPITIGNSSLINERDFELDGEINYKGISYFAFNDHRFVDPLIFDNKQRPYRTYKKDGSLSEWKDGQDYEKWNSIISIPPFGKKIDQSLKKDLKKYGINESQGIYYFILHMIEFLDKGGIFAVVVPSSFLFSGSVQTRKKISDACNVLGLIQLPSGYFYPRHAVGACLVFLEKKENNKEQANKIFAYDIPKQTNPKNYDKLFKEAILKFKKYQDTGKIENANYDEIIFELDIKELDRTWYFMDKTPHFKKLTEIKNAVKLEDVSIIFSSSIPKNELKGRDEGKVVDYLRISDLENNQIKSIIKEQKVVSDEFHRKSSIFLKDDDIVISRQGTVGKLAVVKTNGRKIFPSPQLVVIRPEKKKIDPDYLLFALKSEKTQEQIRMKSKGNFIRGISRASIEKIIISLLPLSEQKAKSKEIEKLQRKIDELESQITRAKKQMEEI